MKSKFVALAAAGLFALTAVPAAAATETFDGPVATGSTAAPGVWYTDRYAPAGFATSGGVLVESISAADSAANRPGAFSGAFYNTQGRKLDVEAGSQILSINLFVDSAWSSLNQRIAGFWGQASDPNNTPILEYTNDGGTGRFRWWDTANGGWNDLGLPTGFAADSWYNLSIELTGGNYVYTVGDLTATASAAGATSLDHVILQGYNAGADYSIQWDNLNSAVPEPATWAMMIAGFGMVGSSMRSRRRTLAAA